MTGWVVEAGGKYWDGEAWTTLNGVCVSKTRIQAKEFMENSAWYNASGCKIVKVKIELA